MSYLGFFWVIRYCWCCGKSIKVGGEVKDIKVKDDLYGYIMRKHWKGLSNFVPLQGYILN